MLPIQRELLSGEKVPCWMMPGAPEVRLWSWYQRTPSTSFLPLPLTLTDWFTTADSTPLASVEARYEKRYMSRSASESSLVAVPGCGMQAPPPHAGVNAATAMLVGPVNVALAGLAKSEWKRQMFSEFEP